MSKIAKIMMYVLGGIVFVVTALCFLAVFQKQQVERSKVALENELEGYRQREKDYILKSKKLETQVEEAEKAKSELEAKLAKFEDVDIDGMKEKMADLLAEKDAWEEKLEALKEEKEDLLAKMQKKPEEKVVYKYVESEDEVPVGSEIDGTSVGMGMAAESLEDNGELYWAKVLKVKTALELEVEKLKKDLADSTVAVTELKKKNSDLQLELSKLSNDKEEIARQIKYGKDLSDSLSLELARAQNEKKFLNDRMSKIGEENAVLRGQIKKLTSTKIGLEKTIVRLQDEKTDIEKRLLETENVIQGRIDEIWQIKKSLDESFASNAPLGNQVDLPPIVVSTATSPEEVEAVQDVKDEGLTASVVSINKDNNFVIIDAGEDAGVRLGDTLNIYRGAEFVAGVEVIQVRNDISAADIVNSTSEIQVGDIVR